MSIPTCTVTVNVATLTGAAVSAATVMATLSGPESTDDGLVVPGTVSAITDGAGVCTLALFPNALGRIGGTRYVITITTPTRTAKYHAVVPDQDTADLQDILVASTAGAAPLTSAVVSVSGIPPDATGDVDLDLPWINPFLPPYSLPADTADAITILRQVEADLYAAGGGHIRLPRGVPISAPLRLRDTVHLHGSGISDDMLWPTTSFQGAGLVEMVPVTGKTDGVLVHEISDFRLAGNGVGRYSGTGTVTAGQATITSVVWSGTGYIPAGWLVRGPGIPEGATVVSHTIGGLQLSAVADLTWGDGTPLRIFEAVTVTGACTAGSKVVTVSSTTGLKRGMRLAGSPLGSDDDDPDLNQWGRIDTIGTGQITMDTAAKTTSGSFSLLAWVAVDGLRWLPASSAEGYDANKKYAAPRMHNGLVRKLSGTGVLLRPGRHQPRAQHVKVESCDEYGFHTTACNDARFDAVSAGATGMSCIVFTTCATPRGTGEAYLPEQIDKHHCIRVNGGREVDLSHYDINGPVRFRAVGSERAPLFTLASMNLKWFTKNTAPVGSALQQAYIEGVGAVHVNLIGGGPKYSQASRPQWLFKSTSGATMSWMGTNLILDPEDADCPYSLAISNEPAKVALLALDSLSRVITMGSGAWLPTISCATPGDLSVTYTKQVARWHRMPGGILRLRLEITFTPTHTTAAGEMRITGWPAALLPDASLGDQTVGPAAVGGADADWGAGMSQVQALLASSSGNIKLVRFGDNKAPTTAAIGNFVSGSQCQLVIAGDIETVPAPAVPA